MSGIRVAAVAAGGSAPASIQALMSERASGASSRLGGIFGLVLPSTIITSRLSSLRPGATGGPCVPPFMRSS